MSEGGAETDPSAPGDASAMTRLLAPLDGSERAKAALPYAAALATPGTEIVLLTVVPGDAQSDDARVELEKVAQDLRGAGHAVRIAVEAGDPAERIINTAQDLDASMIVMASQGRGAVGRLLNGSVADRVGREATTPVLVVRAEQAAPGPVGITRLVVPLDGSPLAEQALPVAEALSKRLGTPLYLVRAVNPGVLIPPAVGFGEAIPAEIYEETEEQLEKDARNFLDDVAKRLRDQGLSVATRVLSGPPATAIMEATQPGDIVVLCSHERTGVMRWLLGSVAEQLTREDQSPVILVPASDPAQAG